MVPIHDTDLTEQRSGRAFETEWAQYELWEKVEIRLRRRKVLWIIGTVLCFLLISSIPILMDHWPKWTALRLSRKLADQMNLLKRQASIDHRAFRIRFENGLNYVVEQSASCQEGHPTRVRTGELESGRASAEFVVLTSEQARGLGVPGVVAEFCYDHISGSEPNGRDEALVGFGIIPVKDLTEGRMDRLSLLLLKGPSAEISFE